VIDTPKRCHQHIRYVDERVRLPGYEGEIRQLAVTGLGREQATLFLSNNLEQTGRGLIVRYAGRNRVEDGLGQAVNFFHLDCLASEVRLNVDLDTALTVLANGCYRWLGFAASSADPAVVMAFKIVPASFAELALPLNWSTYMIGVIVGILFGGRPS
jgi:hypothetical protein